MQRKHLQLWVALLLGLALRLALWGNLPRLGMVGDEAEYLAAADWLAHGRGFAWHLQYLWTRAPLYPLFLAAHLALFGGSQTPIFISQTILSLLNVGLVYLLARQVVGAAPQPALAPGIAATLTAIYLPLATYGQLLLSETLFTSLLLGALALLGAWARRGGWAWLVGAGALLGLATLTRGMTLGFLPIVAGWVVFNAKCKMQNAKCVTQGAEGWGRDNAKCKMQNAKNNPQHAKGWIKYGVVQFCILTFALCILQCKMQNAKNNPQHAKEWIKYGVIQFCILTFAFCIVLLPWTLYASRTYGGLVVVDTTGAFNLALGARTAYDSGRSDAPLRNFVLALLDPTLSESQRRGLLADQKGGSCLFAAGDGQIMAALGTPTAQITQADRQRLLSAEAFCLLRAAPGAFVKKSLIELVDLFQINYTGDERLSRGFALGRLPPWYTLALFLLDDTLYVITLPLAVIGWALLRIEGEKSSIEKEVPLSQCSILIGLWLLYNLGTAPLLFAINRFRVPLMPLVFVLAAYALASLPRWGNLRTRYGAACAALAGLLLLVAGTPYAYLEPRAPGAPSRWASYLGPYPSSLSSTWLALGARPGYEAEQYLAAALSTGDVAAAHEALGAADLPDYAAAVGSPLLAGLEGRPAAGLDHLASEPVQPLEDWQRSLIAGELFRQLGDLGAARRELNPSQVDDQNPVEWAWQWLHPPPTPGNRIDSADDNDLGYIRGFYLGRYDADLGATVRWASSDSALRFPHAASGDPQQLCLNVSGLGWPQDLTLPTVAVALDAAPVGSFTLSRELSQVCLDLPARPAGASLTITLHSSDTFVPDALDLVRQQGPQVGQLRRLAYQLDWAEVR